MTEYIGWLTSNHSIVLDESQEIIRCKSCKHYNRRNDDEGLCFIPDDDGCYVRWMVDADGYCYRGERVIA